jgi:DNA-binding response OmpR family regulator
MQSINVLVLDDDIMVQKLADMALADRGMKIHGASNTTEADSILRREKIDVIVCDVMMSPENGLDYCNRLRRRSIQTPVILISAQASPVAMNDAMSAGASAYLIKPFGIEQIYQRVLEVLAAEPTHA